MTLKSRVIPAHTIARIVGNMNSDVAMGATIGCDGVVFAAPIQTTLIAMSATMKASARAMSVALRLNRIAHTTMRNQTTRFARVVIADARVNTFVTMAISPKPSFLARGLCSMVLNWR